MNLHFNTVIKATLIDEDGVVVDERETTNFMTEFGEAWVADRLSDQGQTAMSYMAIGEGTGQTRLSLALATPEGARVAVTPTQGLTVDDNDVIAIGTFSAAGYSGLITEGGTFNHISASQMLNYWNFSPGINKTTSQTLVVTVTITCGYS